MKLKISKLRKIIKEETIRLAEEERHSVSSKKVEQVYRHTMDTHESDIRNLVDGVTETLTEKMKLDEESVYAAVETLETNLKNSIRKYIETVAKKQLKNKNDG
jgi:ribosomal protein L6P/L9E